MKLANWTCKLRSTSPGVVKMVLAIILLLTTLGICISRFGTTVGLLSGVALATAACGTFVLLANIRHVLEESRAMGADSTRHKRQGADPGGHGKSGDVVE